MSPSLALLLLVAGIALSHPVSQEEMHADQDWHYWKAVHGKSYTSEEVEKLRWSVWKDNLARIENHNANSKRSFTLKINHFGDLTNSEFRELNKAKRPEKKSGSTFQPANDAVLPQGVDWREKGYVTGVKNQGQCGSCWSFSTTGSLEGQMFNKTGKLIPLSEQQLVDCDNEDHGCNGGLMDYAFEYIEKYGLESEEAYPYHARDMKCKYDKSKVVATVKGFKDVPKEDEQALTMAIAQIGPISVAIDASHFSFQFYHQGVYDEPSCSSENLDHGVLAVGYGKLHHMAVDFYIVKNSWGPRWGQEGYIMMSRNKNNQCGIASAASYPLV